MLVMAHKEGDVTHIGDNIQIKVTKIDSQANKVNIAFLAPKEVKILRDKVKRSDEAKANASRTGL